MGLFDDIPAAPKAAGLFDDLPSAAPKAAPRQPDDSPRASFARPMIGTADPAAGEAQREPDVGQMMLQGRFDSEAAIAQRASPVVRDNSGNFVRKVIGEVEDFDFGPAIRKEDGSYLAFNPQTDVMLRDPASGKRVAFERDTKRDTNSRAEGVGRTLLEGFMVGPVSRLASSGEIPMAVQRARSLGFPTSAKTAQMGERIEDAAAFRALETEPFAPAFRSKPAARFARTVEEMPVVGGIVKGPKSETETKLAQAQGRIASELGAPQSDEAAGRVLQTGLDRFRTAGVRQIEPGVLAERGIEARAPVQPAEALSQGARRSAENAEPIRDALGGGVAETVRGVQVPAARPMNQVIWARRAADDLSDTEIDALIRSPASATSFGVRQEALYERAHRKIPNLFKEDGDRNASLIGTPNAGQVAAGLRRVEESARIKGGVLDGRFGQMIRDFANAKSNFTLDSLKAAKGQIGKALASFGEYDTRLDRTQLKALYAAASRDYEAGLQTIANRAYERTKLAPSNPAYVTPAMARAADQALREMRVADRYTRMSMERMDRFTRLLNANSPEAAVRALASKMREGTVSSAQTGIDRGLVRSVADALRPEEREAVLGYLVASMGKTRPGGQESEIIWNIHTFATDWNRNKVTLRLLSKGTDPSIVDRLEALAKISERMKYYETTKNYSGSAYAGIPFAGVIGGAAGGLPGMILTAIGLGGGSAAVGKFLTTPKFLNWMVRAASEGQIPRASGPQVGGTKAPALITTLERLAANDNELGPVIREAITRFRNQAADPAAVDPNTGREGGDALNPEAQSRRNGQEGTNSPLHGPDGSGGNSGRPLGNSLRERFSDVRESGNAEDRRPAPEFADVSDDALLGLRNEIVERYYKATGKERDRLRDARWEMIQELGRRGLVNIDSSEMNRRPPGMMRLGGPPMDAEDDGGDLSSPGMRRLPGERAPAPRGTALQGPGELEDPEAAAYGGRTEVRDVLRAGGRAVDAVNKGIEGAASAAGGAIVDTFNPVSGYRREMSELERRISESVGQNVGEFALQAAVSAALTFMPAAGNFLTRTGQGIIRTIRGSPNTAKAVVGGGALGVGASSAGQQEGGAPATGSQSIAEQLIERVLGPGTGKPAGKYVADNATFAPQDRESFFAERRSKRQTLEEAQREASAAVEASQEYKDMLAERRTKAANNLVNQATARAKQRWTESQATIPQEDDRLQKQYSEHVQDMNTRRNEHYNKSWQDRAPTFATIVGAASWIIPFLLARRGFNKIAAEGETIIGKAEAARAANNARAEAQALIELDRWANRAMPRQIWTATKAAAIPAEIRAGGEIWDKYFIPEGSGAQKRATEKLGKTFGSVHGFAEEMGPSIMSGLASTATAGLTSRSTPKNAAAGELSTLRNVGEPREGLTPWSGPRPSNPARSMSPDEIASTILARRPTPTTPQGQAAAQTAAANADDRFKVRARDKNGRLYWYDSRNGFKTSPPAPPEP